MKVTLDSSQPAISVLYILQHMSMKKNKICWMNTSPTAVGSFYFTEGNPGWSLRLNGEAYKVFHVYTMQMPQLILAGIIETIPSML